MITNLRKATPPIRSPSSKNPSGQGENGGGGGFGGGGGGGGGFGGGGGGGGARGCGCGSGKFNFLPLTYKTNGEPCKIDPECQGGYCGSMGTCVDLDTFCGP